MDETKFWRKLAKRFEKCDPQELLTAEWIYVDDPAEVFFNLPGEFSDQHVQATFNALATIAGSRLPAIKGDIVRRWLMEVKKYDYSEPFSVSPFIHHNADWTVAFEGTEYRGCILNLAQASATCCRQLEMVALERLASEAREPTIITAPGEAPAPATPPLTVGQQIKALRERCGWTQEELAGFVDFSTSTVVRHEKDGAKPYMRTLKTYERIFSKELKEQVLISKMP